MTTTTSEQTFEEEVEEWVRLTDAMIGTEVREGGPPPPPWDPNGPPFESLPRLDSELITRHVLRIGNDNPLFADPEYGKHTRWGCQIAPGNILGAFTSPQIHGVMKPGGYPFLTFFSGIAYEFYDVVRVGTKIRNSVKLREVARKESDAQGKFYVPISEVPFTDFHGDLLAVARCTEIMVPRDRRRRENLDAGTMYTRREASYTPEQIEEFIKEIEQTERRGAEPRYWEDVEIGDKLPPFVYRPHSLQDMLGSSLMGPGGAEYENLYLRTKPTEATGGETSIYPIRVHPVTRWPYASNAEHQDPVLAPYRGQPTAFDNGPDRVQLVPKMVLDWMGDDAFLFRHYSANRRPVYYGDCVIYRGEVKAKFKRTHRGESGRGAVPGEQEYCAVGIRIEATSPGGQPVEGSATVYLPSREHGPVVVPVPHTAAISPVSYDEYRKDWY